MTLPESAAAEGAAVRALLPPELAGEFEDPVEVYQLKRQFQALLDFAGDDGDGLLQASE